MSVKKAVVKKKAAATKVDKVGAEVDKLYAIEQKIKAQKLKIKKLEDVLSDIQKEYNEAEKRVFDQFGREEIEGAKGSKCLAVIERKTYGTIKDPKKFYEWLAKEKKFDILQRRINNAAYMELSAEGKKALPGLAPFVKVRIKLSRRSK